MQVIPRFRVHYPILQISLSIVYSTNIGGQKELTQAFAGIETQIDITFDLWSFPAHRAFLGVIAIDFTRIRI